MGQRVTVADRDHKYTYYCESDIEVWRARTMLFKEAGTIAWLSSELKDGDVFFDIGANIGQYTLFAARRIGATGGVFAFEPHVGNVQSLLRNLVLNRLTERVKVLSCALNDREGFFDFNYIAWIPGSSMSQLNERRDGEGRAFQPVFSELKYAVTADRLIESGAVRSPDLIKIDVDGNELLVLKGMSRLLSGPTPPRSLQVEINERYREQLLAFMNEHGFELATRHETLAGKKKLDANVSPVDVAHNAVFRRKQPNRVAS
jgi:FkbM family methyltransferase